MRKFIVNIVILGLAAITILCFITWLGVRKIDYASFRLSDDTRSIVMGPSTVGWSVNDTLIAGLQTISRDGAYLDCLVHLLPKILDENPQIDTVYINQGRFMFMQELNWPVKNNMQYIRSKLSFFWCNRKNIEWRDQPTNIYAAILNSKWYEIFKNKSSILNYVNGFKAIFGHSLYDDSSRYSIAWYDSITSVHGGNVYTKEEILEKGALTEKYSRMAISICKEHNVVPVLFFSPLYHYEKWFPYEAFCEVMKDYDQDILVADYENFVFSNDSLCRHDVHHLNIYGANEFSNYLAKNGIQTVKLKDWILSKSH